jgi:hypothetical protein
LLLIIICLTTQKTKIELITLKRALFRVRKMSWVHLRILPYSYILLQRQGIIPRNEARQLNALRPESLLKGQFVWNKAVSKVKWRSSLLALCEQRYTTAMFLLAFDQSVMIQILLHQWLYIGAL